MRYIVALGITLISGCIFSGSTAAVDEDFGPETDMSVTDGSRPDEDVGGSVDMHRPVDVGTPDAQRPPDASRPPVDGGPSGDWQLPDYDKRQTVTWLRSGAPVADFVVPLRVPGPDNLAVNASAVLPDGTVLASEQDGPTLWVRIPDFGAEGELRLYFDGPPADFELDEVWAGYEGVWHFSGGSPGGDSSGLNNTMTGVTPRPTGVVGPSAQMPPGGGSNPLLTTTLDLTRGDHTVEFWLALTADTIPSQTSTNRIYDQLVNNQRRVALRWNNPTDIAMFVTDVGEVSESRLASYTSGAVHVAVVVDNTAEHVQLFVGGVLGATIPFPSPGWRPVEQLSRFGASWAGGGFIDEARVSLQVRSPAYMSAVARSYVQGDSSIFTYGMVERYSGP